MASRTQIVCLCEGEKGNGERKTSVDLVFINTLIRTLKPSWVRREGSNWVDIKPCGGRPSLVKKMPDELKTCLDQGGHTTLMVWADCDHDCNDGNALRQLFWKEAEGRGITQEQFDRVVFIFAKDRLENWIQFLTTGQTDESEEGPRVKDKHATDAAKELAKRCTTGSKVGNMPPSLQWSCQNWHSLKNQMK